MISIYYFNKCKLIYKYDIHVWFKLKYMFKKKLEKIFFLRHLLFFFTMSLKEQFFTKKNIML